jgi:three-Cys-motif partner protein
VLDHSSLDRILQRSEMHFYFIERDEGNLQCLEKELTAYTIPSKIKVTTQNGNCFERLSSVVSGLRQKNASMAPAFFFIDPYGFKVPGSLLRDLMSFPRVELFVNVIWRELDMATRGSGGVVSPGMKATLDSIFCDNSWEQRVASTDFDERANQAVDLLREKIGAKWGTSFRMCGENNATRYLLLHLTNHDDGRDLMKERMWKVCPQGGFYARKSDNSAQQFLIKPEPDLRPLRNWVVERLKTGPRRWSDLAEDLRPEIWRSTQLNEIVRNLRKEKIIEGAEYKGRFGFAANPLLSLVVN